MLLNYLSGRANSDEKSTVEGWLAEDPLNEGRLEQIREVWEHTGSLPEMESVDLEGDWNRISRRIGFDRGTGRKEPFNSNKAGKSGPGIVNFRSYPLLKIAALIVLIAVPVVLLELKLHIVSSPEVAWLSAVSGSERKDLVLPDGTRLTLNVNSRVSWPENFEGRKREVELEGEAWFDVAENPGQPFLIRTGEDMLIEVLGTSFTIRTDRNTGEVQVRVISGKVSFYRERQKGKGLVLETGEMGTGNGNGFSKSSISDPNFLSWKTGRLEFRNTRLREVIKSLAEYSGRTLLIGDDSLGNLVLTASFENQELDEIMEEIRLVLGLDYSVENDTVIFHPAGAE